MSEVRLGGRALVGGVVVVLLLTLVARGLRTTAAVAYLFLLTTALAWFLPRALGAPRLARALTALVVVLTGVLALRGPGQERIESYAGTVTFSDARARAFHTLVPPREWRGRGDLMVYVALDGDAAAIVSAGPCLAWDGGRLEPLTAAPDRPGCLRAPLPRAALERDTLTLSFGFERPRPDVALFLAIHHDGSLSRAPSAWSVDGNPPSPGAPLVPRSRSAFGALCGRARFEQPVIELPGGSRPGRFGFDLSLLAPDGSVCATCY